MSDATPQLLEQLRDVHLPEPVSWWPLAPGYWIVLALVVVVLGMLAYWLRHQPKRKTQHLKQAALREMAQLYSTWQEDHNTAHYLQGLNGTLKRLLLAQNVISVAKLSGDQWLAALGRLGSLQNWSESSRHALAYGVYQSNADQLDAVQLHQEVVAWLGELSVDAKANREVTSD